MGRYWTNPEVSRNFQISWLSCPTPISVSALMSAIKSGSSLRSLVLTPERIPSFLIPSRSPRLRRGSSDRTRLLLDPEDDTVAAAPAVSPRGSLLRVPSPRVRPPRRAAAGAEDADTDLTTRAAMSLPHVGKVTTPYGFRAVLAASPCTRRRESLFHKSKPVTRREPQGPVDLDPVDLGPAPARSRSPMVRLQPIRAFGLQVMEELKKPAAALRARRAARDDAVGETDRM